MVEQRQGQPTAGRWFNSTLLHKQSKLKKMDDLQKKEIKDAFSESVDWLTKLTEDNMPDEIRIMRDQHRDIMTSDLNDEEEEAATSNILKQTLNYFIDNIYKK